jgi:hypothetical protein
MYKLPRKIRPAVTKRTWLALNLRTIVQVMEGIMDGRFDCCRYEPSLEELLADDVMAPVLRSAGFDTQGFRDMMAETARRIDRGTVDGPDKGGN